MPKSMLILAGGGGVPFLVGGGVFLAQFASDVADSGIVGEVSISVILGALAYWAKGYVEQAYLSEPRAYYEPTDRGYEARIRERLRELRRRGDDGGSR